MLKSFCDVCGNECDVSSSGAKVFENLIDKVGLQFLPVFDGVPSPTNHVCPDCTPNLLLKAAKTFEQAPLIIQLRANAEQAVVFSSNAKQLEKKLAELAELEKNADERMKEAEAQIADAKAEKASYVEKFKVLEAQIITKQNLTVDYRKQLLAASKQALIDLNDDPEAVESINKRERLRASK